MRLLGCKLQSVLARHMPQLSKRTVLLQRREGGSGGGAGQAVRDLLGGGSRGHASQRRPSFLGGGLDGNYMGVTWPPPISDLDIHSMQCMLCCAETLQALTSRPGNVPCR